MNRQRLGREKKATVSKIRAGATENSARRPVYRPVASVYTRSEGRFRAANPRIPEQRVNLMLTAPSRIDIEQIVEDFLRTWRHHGGADPARFLPKPTDPHYNEALVELLRTDLRLQWAHGKRRLLEDYRSRFPDLFADRSLLEKLAAEEYGQRLEAGETVAPHDYVKRYGVSVDDWVEPTRVVSPESMPSSGPAPLSEIAGDLSVSIEEVRKVEPELAKRFERAAKRMPQVGDRFYDFKLIGELGRGAFGQVFLASQLDLADRFVAVKITAGLSGEPQKLAQLQHTNIVPIYSAHSVDGLQAVVMPFLGSTTLAQVLGHLRAGEGPMPSSGRYVLSTLKQQRTAAKSQTPAPESGSDPTRNQSITSGAAEATHPRQSSSDVVLKMFADMTYVDAVLWIASRIAGGLAHAHERGILHRDLKPTNILLTDEGQPMLLDFNLAEDMSRRAGPTRARLGGTLPYMSPEQLAAITGAERTLDERSDLYSLGIVLFELLTGRFPFAAARTASPTNFEDMLANRIAGAPSLRQFNSAVSPAVDAIVHKLLAPDPEWRYSLASDLQEDLERQLADKHLLHAPEPSARERWGKWRRRNPRLATALFVGLAATIFFIVPATVGAIRMKQSADDKRLVETKKTENLRLTETKEAEDLLALTKTEYLEAHSRLTTRNDRNLLQGGLDRAREILNRYGIGDNDAWTEQTSVARLSEEERKELRVMVGDMLLLSTRGEYLLAEDAKAKEPERLKSAQHWNDVAKSFFGADGAPRSIWKQQADLFKAAGNEARANENRAIFQRQVSRSDFDQYSEAADLAAAGDYKEALAKIEPVTRRNPKYFAAWFVQGNCQSELDRFADAVASYTACIVSQERAPAPYVYRGIARMQLRDPRKAEMDFTRALELQPDNVEARVNRGIARFELKMYDNADSDLTASLEFADVPTRVWFIRAMVRRAAGDAARAETDYAEGLRRIPSDSLSWAARGRERQQKDPKGALDDYNESLKQNPRQRHALINKVNVLAEKLKQPEEAIKVLNRMAELFPEDPDVFGSRGVILARLGKVEEARKDAQHCLVQSRSAFVCFQVAGIYAQVSKHTKSAEDRGWALQLLGVSVRKGFDQLELVASDPDLDPIRKEPEFRRLAELAANLVKETAPKR